MKFDALSPTGAKNLKLVSETIEAVNVEYGNQEAADVENLIRNYSGQGGGLHEHLSYDSELLQELYLRYKHGLPRPSGRPWSVGR